MHAAAALGKCAQQVGRAGQRDVDGHAHCFTTLHHVGSSIFNVNYKYLCNMLACMAQLSWLHASLIW